MSDACKACGAGAELERNVIDREARACMACGAVRVFTFEVVYSDNPHVDPEVVWHEVSVDPEGLAWIRTFPRSTKSDGLMPASTRAATIELLQAAERTADDARGTTFERWSALGLPTAPPTGHSSVGMTLFQNLYSALLPGANLETLLVHAAGQTSRVATVIARERLATRAGTFSEVARSIEWSPALITASLIARPVATADEVDELARAVQSRIARTDPHSSYVSELQRVLAKLRAPA